MKKGETLIEVLIAMALFSAAAISVVGIMNHGVNNIQTSLETTLARTEIDAQAEALRFIQEAYLSDKNTGLASSAWRYILENLAINPDEYDAVRGGDIVNCENFYTENLRKDSESILKNKAFVLNTRNLGDVAQSSEAVVLNQYSNLSHTKAIFETSPANPRLVYQGEDQDGEDFYSDSEATTVSRAEGMWIVAVRSDNIENEEEKTGVEYVDFYVYTCWDSLGNVADSNISSTIRLHNPDAVSRKSNSLTRYTVTYEDWDGDWKETDQRTEYIIKEPLMIPSGYIFAGWTVLGGDDTLYQAGDQITLTGDITFTAQWKELKTYCVEFKAVGTGVSNMPTAQCVESAEGGASISLNGLTTPIRDKFDFAGWSLDGSIVTGLVTVSDDSSCDGQKQKICLETTWSGTNRFVVTLNWIYPYGIYVKINSWTKVGKTKVYYNNRSYNNNKDIKIVGSGYDFYSFIETTNIELKQGLDKDVYFSVWLYTDWYYYIHGGMWTTWANVTVKQYDANDNLVGQYNFAATNNNRCWNVFAIKNGDTVIDINRGTNTYNASICADMTYDLSKYSAKGAS